MFNLNAEIISVLDELNVPVALSFYEGTDDTYIVFSQSDKDAPLYGDEEILGCFQYYDFDIYSKGNYLSVATQLIELLTAAGWTYTPDRDSPDLYERDTKYFHKTICLCKESEVI